MGSGFFAKLDSNKLSLRRMLLKCDHLAATMERGENTYESYRNLIQTHFRGIPLITICQNQISVSKWSISNGQVCKQTAPFDFCAQIDFFNWIETNPGVFLITGGLKIVPAKGSIDYQQVWKPCNRVWLLRDGQVRRQKNMKHRRVAHSLINFYGIPYAISGDRDKVPDYKIGDLFCSYEFKNGRSVEYASRETQNWEIMTDLPFDPPVATNATLYHRDIYITSLFYHYYMIGKQAAWKFSPDSQTFLELGINCTKISQLVFGLTWHNQEAVLQATPEKATVFANEHRNYERLQNFTQIPAYVQSMKKEAKIES